MNISSYKNLIIPQSVKVYLNKTKNTLLFRYNDEKWCIFLPENILLEKFQGSLRFNQNSKNQVLINTIYYIIKNLIQGMIKKYNIYLIIKGLGLKSQQNNGILSLKLGFSHSIDIDLNVQSVNINSPKPNIIILNSSSKQDLGNILYKIHNIKKPDVYKNKGLLIRGKPLIQKVGKKS